MSDYNRLLSILGLAMAVGLAGCSSITQSFAAANEPAGVQTAGKPIPRVQDCGVIQAGTPSRFVCNGKIYTSYELATLREQQAKKLQLAN